MAYNSLSNDSGQTQERRNQEALKIAQALAAKIAEMTPTEAGFIGKLHGLIGPMGFRVSISAKQLFWLRDLREKYL
jgi:hypothetical protein